MDASCEPWRHNRLHEHYDNRMCVVQEGNGWHRERCKVCGAEYLQTHAWKIHRDKVVVDTDISTVLASLSV